MTKPRFATLCGIIFLAALSRVIPHPWNFTPVTAIALFGGAYFTDKRLAFAVPLSALFLSDLFLGFYATVWMTYIAFALVVCIGLVLQKKKSPMRMVGACLAASVSFFLITNFAAWLEIQTYERSLKGLLTAYTMAIPFFRNSLLGDLFFTALLFGSFTLAERKFSSLRLHPIPVVSSRQSSLA